MTLTGAARPELGVGSEVRQLRREVVEHNTGGLHVDHCTDLFATIAEALGVATVRVLATQEDTRAAGSVSTARRSPTRCSGPRGRSCSTRPRTTCTRSRLCSSTP